MASGDLRVRDMSCGAPGTLFGDRRQWDFPGLGSAPKPDQTAWCSHGGTPSLRAGQLLGLLGRHDVSSDLSFPDQVVAADHKGGSPSEGRSQMEAAPRGST